MADTGNHLVRKIANDSQRTVTTLAGTGSPGSGEGPGLQAALNHPQGITVAADGTIFVADTRNHRIVRIARDAPHTLSTWAGNTTNRFRPTTAPPGWPTVAVIQFSAGARPMRTM